MAAGILIGLVLLSLESLSASGFALYSSDDKNGSLCKQRHPTSVGVYNGASSPDSNEVPLAVSAWNDVPTPLSLQPVSNPSLAVILVNNTNNPLLRYNGNTYNAGGDALPQSKLNCSGGYINTPVAITINDAGVSTSESNFPQSVDDMDFRIQIIAHEMGHSLGLAHSTETCSLMLGSPYYENVLQCRVFFPVVDDVRGLAALYGWAADTTFAQSSGQTTGRTPPLELQQGYGSVSSPTTLPSSGIALMMGYVTPYTLYRFRVGWDEPSSAGAYASIELDNDGIKFVDVTNAGAIHNVVNFAGSPTPNNSYFLELILERRPDGTVSATAYAYSGSVTTPNGQEAPLGSFRSLNQLPFGLDTWPTAQSFSAAVWTDSASDPLSDYKVDHFWNFQDNSGSAQKTLTGDFSLTASPSSMTLVAPVPGSGTFSVVARNDFSDTMTLQPQVSPSNGLTVTCSPLTITVLNGQTISSNCSFYPGLPGTYSVTVGASPDGSIGRLRTATITVNVQDFTLSTNPSTLTIHQGASGTSSVTVTSQNGFSGTITFSASTSSSGATASFSPPSVTLVSGGSQSSTLSVQIGSTVPAGTVSVTITATYTPSTVHTTPVYVTVTGGDFSIAANPTSVSVQQGSTNAHPIVTVTSLSGFGGPVTLVAGTTACLYAVFDAQPQPVCTNGNRGTSATLSVPTGNSASIGLWVSACLTTPPGTYYVTVTGTSRSLSHSTTIAVQVLSGPGCDSGSVAAGTLITLANRTQVPVENLRAGLTLLSYNVTTKQFETSSVTRMQLVPTDDELTIHTSAGPVLLTDNSTLQKLWVRQSNGNTGWIPVTQLRIGDYLYQPLKQQWTRVTQIDYTPGSFVMYDIYTTAPGNYIANGYLDPVK